MSVRIFKAANMYTTVHGAVVPVMQYFAVAENITAAADLISHHHSVEGLGPVVPNQYMIVEDLDADIR